MKNHFLFSQRPWRHGNAMVPVIGVSALLAISTLLASCTLPPAVNIAGYWLAAWTGGLRAHYTGPGGTVRGSVLVQGQPLAGATVLVAERNATTHSTQSDEAGTYVIKGVPPGRYVPAAVAPGYTESELENAAGTPLYITVHEGAETTVPPLHLTPYRPPPLPMPLAPTVNLSITARFAATTTFPTAATADVTAFRFTYAGAQIDTLRLYLPATRPEGTNDHVPTLPLLFMVYPTSVDLWQSISVAYAVQNYAVLAISPIAARGLDIEAHATDARVGLTLAEEGALSAHIQRGPVIALGGSFSSAVLHRLLRGSLAQVASASPSGDAAAPAIIGWVTVGGITDAFSGTAAFYRGELTIPPEYQYLIPALGAPNLNPLAFLRYSPVYTAAQLPPTLIIHTAADHVIPIEQAYELEDALHHAGVPTEVYYYKDVSHYLQIDDQMTDAGREMFYIVLDFADRMLKQ